MFLATVMIHDPERGVVPLKDGARVFPGPGGITSYHLTERAQEVIDAWLATLEGDAMVAITMRAPAGESATYLIHYAPAPALPPCDCGCAEPPAGGWN